MKWTPLADEGEYRRLDLEVPWEEIAREYEELVAQYRAALNLPGFRPGKAPREAVERRCGEEILAELSARTVRRLGREVGRQAGIEALGRLEASEIQCDRGRILRAVVRYVPMPEFRLPELAELKFDDDGTDAKDRISRQLLDLVQFEVPADLVRQELAVDGFEGSAPGSDSWITTAERIRLMVILKRIARREGIEVDEADVARRIQVKAEEFGTSAKGLQAELERGGGTARLRDVLLAERTLEYLTEAVFR